MIRFVVPWDGSSRKGGAGSSAAAWNRLIPKRGTRIIDRSLGTLMGPMLESDVRNAARAGECVMVLGGDHSLTFYAVRALLSYHGRLNLCHFDAHADDARYPDLNNFSVMYHLSRLGVNLVSIGYRTEGVFAAPIPPSYLDGPTYLSVDVDYFSPQVFSMTGDPVPCDPSQFIDIGSFRESLRDLSGPIVGADIMEWRGAPANHPELEYMSELIEVIHQRLDPC